MHDNRVDRLAKLLIEYSTRIGEGDRVAIEAEPAAEPLVRALFKRVLQAGGHPHLLISLSGFVSMSGFDDLFMTYANEEQLSFVPSFYKLAYDNFESRIRIWSQSNTRALSNIDKVRLTQREKTLEIISRAQFERGAKGKFRWLTTMFPTEAYAQDAEMSLSEFEDFLFRACQVDDPEKDPVVYWQGVEVEQKKVVDWLEGHDKVEVCGPHCDLSLSVQGRTFLSSCGHYNMPDGEVYTGPVEESVNGWVRFTVPTSYRGNHVEGVELEFVDGQVVGAKAEKGQSFLEKMLEIDPGARYLGEFAVGTNYGIQRPTRNILFDEKIGGTFHVALGAGYPETGSKNQSAIHWDMITDLKEGGEIKIDGEVIYKDGAFQL
jgi:aminopeptidase